MSTQTIQLEEPLYRCFLEKSLREPDLFRKLREETSALEEGHMQISPEQGQLMSLLVETIGAKKALEVGTFTGYSALWVATALPEGGKLVACDRSETWTEIGKKYWNRAGVGEKVDLRIGPASETLDRLIEEGEAGTFDFFFIDADKTGYDGYYEQGLVLVRSGGLIAFDNMLWGGKIADPTATDAETLAIRAVLDKVRVDDRVSSSLVPIGDGLLLVRKR